MLKDRKSTKIILLIIVIVLMLIPGFRIFHLRGGLMRESRLTTVSMHYVNLGALHIKTTSGNIYIESDEDITGVTLNATNASSNDGNTSNIILSTVSDDIHITVGSNYPVSEIRAENVSGNIMVDGVLLDVLDLSTLSGNIEVYNATVNEDLTLASTSGSIDVNGTTSEKLYTSVKSGDLCIDGAEADSLVLTSISGDMEIINTEAGEVRLTSTSGNTVFHALDDYYLNYSSVSGSVDTEDGIYKGSGLIGNPEASQKILYKSTSGNIEII